MISSACHAAHRVSWRDVGRNGRRSRRARRPAIVVVDGLATPTFRLEESQAFRRRFGSPECRYLGNHAVNIQHLESLNDVVARPLACCVRETIPDHLRRADEVVNVDVSVHIATRLRQGRIYDVEKIQQSLNNFFRKEISRRCVSCPCARWLLTRLPSSTIVSARVKNRQSFQKK